MAFGIAVAQEEVPRSSSPALAEAYGSRSAPPQAPDGTVGLRVDVTDPAHVPALRDAIAAEFGARLTLHAIDFAPEAALGDDFMGATWDDVKVVSRSRPTASRRSPKSLRR